MCWRIVRIQGDGSIKLILASELVCNSNNLTDDSGYATDGAAGVKGNIINDVIYGYDYIDTNDGGHINKTNYFGNITYNNYKIIRPTLNEWLNKKMSSNEIQKLKIDTWYIANLKNAYYLSATDFSSENRIVGNVEDLLKESSNNVFNFNIRNRLETSKRPSYLSETNAISGEVDINNVGMLTIDEIIYSGNASSDYMSFINENAKTSAWHTISFAMKQSVPASISLYSVDKNGSRIFGAYGASSGYLIRPVITLKSTTQISGGNGTISNPYTVK